MGLHLFDSGLRLARRTAIRQAIVAAIEELRRPMTPGAGALYLDAIVELAVPVQFSQGEEEEHFRIVTAGRAPVVAVALGDATFTATGSDNTEWGAVLDVHIYSLSANARGPLARVAGDVASEASINADPGIETIAEHVFERLVGKPLREFRASEFRPMREGFAVMAENAIVFEQVFELRVTTDVNPNRALTQRTTEIDTSHTDHDNPLPAGDADPATGPAPRPLTTLPFGAP